MGVVPKWYVKFDFLIGCSIYRHAALTAAISLRAMADATAANEATAMAPCLKYEELAA